MKIEKAVKKETLYVLVMEIIFSIIMELVFLFIGRWNFTVLWGNILGGSIAVLNFFLMALTIQKNVGREPGKVKTSATLSLLGRYAMILAAGILGGVLNCFNVFAVLIPIVFPRVSMALRPLAAKLKILEM